MDVYFQKEHYNAIFMIILSLISIGLGLIFSLIIKYSFYIGLGCTFIIFGCWEFSKGLPATINSNTQNNQIELVFKKNNKLPNNQPFKIDLKKQQIIYTIWIKTFVFLFVLISLILFKKPSQLFWRGVSLGVLIQLPFIIMFDILTILNMNLLFC